MRFRFEHSDLDVDRRELRVDDDLVHLEPQVFDVLVHLVTHHDRVVGKIEFLDEVWGDRFVSESALTSRIKAARRAIGDDGVQQRLIRTIRGHGYRFVGEVVVVDAGSETSSTPPGSTAPDPDPGPPAPRVSALPVARTRLVGRDQDLESLLDLMTRHRVVTISGPGGAGKTTLALTAAHQVIARHGGEVVLVELAPAHDRPTLVRTVAEAAAIDGPGATDLGELAAALGAREMLLVVDNCEHVLDASAELVNAVLDAGSQVTVLTTSREPLMVSGEAIHPLGSLGAHAPELFVERAGAATGDPELVAASDERVVELCRQLDGLPLAIELAAAQLRHLTIHDLLTRLDDRLGILSGGRPRAGSRHSALAATIAWSHELLGDESRDLFDRLAVFPASFDLAAACAVADVPDGVAMMAMADLVAKNLVVHDASRGRYHLLETIRLYATERMAAAGRHDDLVERLRTHVVARATAHPRHRNWSSTSLAAASLVDLDNVRLAFHASLRAGRSADAVDIALGVSPLWRNATSYAEGLGWAHSLRTCDLAPVDDLWLHIVEADLGLGSGDYRMLVARAGSAADLGRRLDQPEAVVIATILGSLYITDPDTAIIGLQAARDAAQELGEDALERLARAFLVIPMMLQGRTAEVDAEVAAITENPSSAGYDGYISHWAAWLTTLAARDGPGLRRLMDAQLANVRRSGLRENWVMTLCHALTLIGEGRPWLDHLQRARRGARDEGRATGADTVMVLAYDQACQDQFVRAAELLGASSTTMSLDTANFVHHIVIRDLVVAPMLEPDEFAQAMERGRGRAIPEILVEHGL